MARSVKNPTLEMPDRSPHNNAMELNATLIANPERTPLTPPLVEAVQAALAAAGASAGESDWLAPDEACAFSITGMTLEAARNLLADHPAKSEIDIVFQPEKNRRKKLLLADMDSTIVTSETLDELAEFAGLKDQIAAITTRAMRGELDFHAALRERVGMLEGLSEDALEKTWEATELTPGARTLVQTMRANGAYTVLVSGGFRFFTGRVAELVGFHGNFANELLIEDGKLTGKVGEPILDKDSKLETLERLIAERNIRREETMTVGDGANDLPMILAAGLGVAFRAKPLVIAEAPAAIQHGDLTALLYLQGYRKADFIK